MPGMDGVEATRRIKAQWPGVCVIGLSMHAEADMAGAMREAGATGYVVKTQEPAALVAAIRGCGGRGETAGYRGQGTGNRE